MAITTLDLHKEIPKPIFWLAKPNKEIVGKLKVIYNHRVGFKLKKMDELSFSIPFQYEDERTHQLKENPYVDKIKQHYLIKFIYNGKEQWFKIVNISKSDNDKEEYTVSASSLETELKGKKLINYSVTSYNCEQVLTDALKGTKWTIGYIDPEYNKMYRNFETANKSALDFIYNDMTETFEGSVAIFDTINRTVSLFKESDLGENKGLRIKYKKQMENISEDSDASNVVTRLYVYGSENLGIERVNPTGESYIDDFSYFRTLDYMDQDLLDALDNYDNILKNASPIQDEAESGTNETTIKLSNHGLTTGDYVVNRTQGRETRKVTVLDSNTIRVSSVENQTEGDVIEKFSDGTFGKLLFEKEDLQSRLLVRENELNDLLTEKLIILDTLSIQYEANTIDSYEEVISNETINRTLSDLDVNDKYVAMVKVSTTTGTTVRWNGSTRSVSSGAWTVLGKAANRETNQISISTTQSNVSVKTLIVQITDDEYTTSNNDYALIEKYCVDKKDDEINSKENEVDSINDDITSKDADILSLRNSISMESNFTEQQLIDLQDFIYEDEYRNENIVDDKDLLDIGNAELKKKNTPEIYYKTGIINFLESVTEQRNWKKLVLADKVTIIHPVLKINIQSSIIEYEVDFENVSIDLAVASNKDVKPDGDSVLKSIYNNIHATKALNNKKKIWDNAELNFNQRNDRISTKPANPVVKTDGTAIDHVVNKDGSVDVSFEWEYDDFNETGLNKDNIDGFTVYIYSSPNSSKYYIGTVETKEINVDIANPNIRAYGLKGVSATNYYTFGVQAYRVVDNDIHPDGIIRSNIVQPSMHQENPYRPEDNIAFNGDFLGTINGTDANIIISNANDGKSAKDKIDNDVGNGTIENTEGSQSKADQAENNAKGYTDTQIGEVNDSLDTLQQDINDMSSDGKMTRAEANLLEVSLNQVTSESSDLLNIASALSITTERTDYSDALTSLSSYLTNNFINKSSYPIDINSTQRNTIQTRFENVQSTKSILINKISEKRESNAKSYTDTQISEVNTSIDNLQQDISDFSNDGKMTRSEANALEISLNQVVSESIDLINVANGLEITTEKTNYDNAVNDLSSYLTTNFINKSSYPINISVSQRESIKTKFETLQNRKSVLINKISAVRESLAKGYADTQIDEVNDSIDSLQSAINEFSSDGKITRAEANILEISLNELESESTDLINIATSLNIGTEKSNYSTALTNLSNVLSDWINQASYPKTISSTQRTNIQTEFENVQNRKSILVNKIAEKREDNAKSYTDTQIGEVNSSIESLQNDVNDFSSDGKITRPEANSLELSLSELQSESTDLINIATSLSITTERDNYNTALTNLSSTLGSWINQSSYPKTINSSQRSDIKTRFDDVQNRKSILINKIAEKREDNAKAHADQYADDIQEALQEAQSAKAIADGKIVTFYQDNEPSDSVSNEGDLWFDTNDGNKIYTYRNGSWVSTQDSKIAQALDAASDAQATADGKVKTYFTTSNPSGMGIGDLWYNSNNHTFKRWSGSSWETVSDITSENTSKDTENVGGVPSDEVNKSSTTVIVADRSTTQNYKMANFVVPSGSSSAHTTINNAINSLPSNGGKVVLLDGTYNVSGQITVGSNVTLEGQGMSTVIKTDSTSSTYNVIATTNTANNTAIKGLNIDAGNGTGVLLNESTDSRVNDINVTRGSKGIRALETARNTITNCNISNVGTYGVEIRASKETTVSESMISNCDIGVEVVNSHSISVIGSTIVGSSNSGIRLYYISLTERSENNTISGNIIKGNNLSGIFTFWARSNTISGNVVNENGTGINDVNSSDNTITGNIVRRNMESGILVGSHSNVTGNKVSENSQAAHNTYPNISIGEKRGSVTVNSSYAIVSSNSCRRGDLTNKPNYGIFIVGSGCTGNFIVGNDLYQSGSSGSLSDQGTGTKNENNRL